MFYQFPKLSKSLVIIILFAFVFNLIILSAPQLVYAQGEGAGVGIPVMITGSLVDMTKSIKTMILNLLKGVLMQAIFKILNYASQKLAYDAAVWIGSGGKGQGTLYENRGWGNYMKDMALNSVGEGLGALDEAGIMGGFSLCDPSIQMPEMKNQLYANLKINIIETYEPQPKCRWNDITANWNDLASSVSSGELLSNFMDSIVPGEGGIESLMSLQIQTAENQRNAVEIKTTERTAGGGFKAVTDFAGNIKTPTTLIEGQVKQAMFDKPAKTQEQQSTGLFTSGDSWMSMGLNMASMFLNTLASTLFKKISTGLFDASSQAVSLTRPEVDLGPPGGGREAAQTLFADLLTPQLIETGKYNPIYDFAACPEERGMNNCVIDMNFLTVVEQGSGGGDSMTVSEAIKQGLLNKDWPLISPSDPKNQDNDCYNKGYCYSNLVKLRKMRIIPIGWELAAQTSKQEKPITLGEVVNNFNNCPTDGNFANYPYCHLIDPNWILKMPAAECKMEAYGPRLLASQMAEREKICVDVASCVEEDSKGQCIGPYAYCTKDKSIWRLKGDSCPAEYSSCQTLTSRQGKKVAYLLNTVDYGTCNEQNVGCKWYSKERQVTPIDKWLPSERIYLNKNAKSCPAEQSGCSELVRVGDGTSVNLLKNPSFEDTAALNGWTTLDGSPLVTRDGSNSNDGNTAVNLSGVASIAQAVLNIKENNYYSFSYYAKSATAGTENAKATILVEGTGADYLERLKNIETNCVRQRDPGGNFTGWLTLELSSFDFYDRVGCYFNSPVGATRVSVGLEGTNVWLDAVQLEEGKTVNEFRTNSYPSAALLANLKVAPKYLNCDSNNPSADCAGYAAFCKADEVGCELYRSTTDDFEIPAIAGNDDKCPAECNGYDVFKQEATNFEAEKSSIYSIPQYGLSCKSEEAGCDEFTNNATEEVKYFSYLRPCVLPGEDSATYYTWEGSDTVGYQLRTWVLKKGGAQSDGSTPPAYVDGFADYLQCTKSIFQSGADPDCREFYDAQGNISYRLYSKTIVATNDCKNYRKTIGVAADCPAFGGVWQDNKCFYNGFDAESKSCASKAAGCRAYTGAASRNVRNLFTDEFEAGTVGDWQANASANLSVSSESLYVGGHSLKVSNTSPFFQKNIKDYITKGKTYFVSFWAKATPINLANKITSVKIQINPNKFFDFGEVRLSPEWQAYTVGPLLVSEAPADGTVLKFGANYSVIYIDNITLKEISDSVYLIKDSWTIPASCDVTAEGTLLPGAMLGCKEYKDRNGVLNYLKSFKNLCRDAAVGCEEFIDKKSTESLGEEVYNAVCERVEGNVLTSKLSPNKDEAECGDKAVLLGDELIMNSRCTIPKGEDKCYFNDPGPSPLSDRFIDEKETFIAPADERLYLVANDNAKCSAENVGCTAVAEPTEGVCNLRRTDVDRASRTGRRVGAQTLEICVNPNGCYCYENEIVPSEETLVTYPPGEALCLVKKDEKSCKFKAKTYFDVSDFNAIHFLDFGRKSLEFEAKSFILKPADFGDILCKGSEDRCESWGKISELKGKTNTSILYFKDPAGAVCEYKDKISVGGVEKSGWFKEGTEVPCYVGYEKMGLFGIWKNGDDKYTGFVGKCLDQYSTCTTIEDPQTKETYYFKRNKNLDESSCNGLVSPKQGCVLFSDANDPAIYWNSFASNLESEKIDGGLVRPSSTPYKKGDYMLGWTFPDSNLILKVQRDRVCDEWLDCRSTATVWDENAGNYKSICTDLGVCSDYQKVGDKYVCSEFKEANTAELPLDAGVFDSANHSYQSREVSYQSADYSGYSIPGLFNRYSTQNSAAKDEQVTKMCRVYPEMESPFPSGVAEWDFTLDGATKGKFSGKKQGFEQANIYEKSFWSDMNSNSKVDAGEIFEQSGDGCEYQKVKYGGVGNKYFSYNTDYLPAGYCSAGEEDGLVCDPRDKNACKGAGGAGVGTCEKYTAVKKYLGLRGQCLEKDLSLTMNGDSQSHPCLTWWPKDVADVDIYNSYTSAGYNPPVGQGKFYCFDVQSGLIPGTSTNYPYDPYLSGKAPEYLSGEGSPNLGDADGDYREYFAYKPWLGPEVSGYKYADYITEDNTAAFILTPYSDRRWLAGITKNGQNILSRKGKTGTVKLGDKTYKYWESRYPGTDTSELIAGSASRNSQTPLFIYESTASARARGVLFYDGLKGDIVREDVYYNNDLNLSKLNENDERKCLSPNERGEESSNQSEEGFYFAIRAIFDPSAQNKFVGFWTSICESTNKATTYQFLVSHLQVPICTKVAEVSNGGENKANMSYMWEQSNKTSPSRFTFITSGTNYRYAQNYVPFGSVLHRDQKPSDGPWYVGQWPIKGDEENSTFGSPYLSSNYFSHYVDAGSPVIGGSGYDNQSLTDLLKGTSDSNRLFGKSYNIYSWNFGTHKYEKEPLPGWNWETNFITSTSPQVVAIDSSGVLTTAGTPKPARAWSVTINGKDSSNVEGHGGQLKAVMQFYGWTGSGTMPLVSRTIDWGDGSVDTLAGKYKNHKPICASYDNEPLGLCSAPNATFAEELRCKESTLNTDCLSGTVCQNQTGSLFGDSPGACHQGYFEFTHTYVCNNAVTSCVYHPKVILRDNWGRCNGNCVTGGTPFDGEIIVYPE